MSKTTRAPDLRAMRHACIEASNTFGCDRWGPLISTAAAERMKSGSTSPASSAMSAQFSR